MSPDIVDFASDYETKERAAALSRVVTYTGKSATYCAECGLPIPEARRKAVPGVKLCRDCQEERE